MGQSELLWAMDQAAKKAFAAGRSAAKLTKRGKVSKKDFRTKKASYKKILLDSAKAVGREAYGVGVPIKMLMSWIDASGGFFAVYVGQTPGLKMADIKAAAKKAFK